MYGGAVGGEGGGHLQGEPRARGRVLAPRGGGAAVHGLVQVDDAAPVRRGPGPHPVVDRVSERERRRRSVSGGRLLTSPGSSWASWQSNIARSLVVGGLDRDISARVVARHGARVVVVGQCSGTEIMRQGSCSLKGGGVVVMEVGRGDEMGRMKRLLVVSVMSMMPDMMRRKTRVIIESRGSAGRTWLLVSVRNIQ